MKLNRLYLIIISLTLLVLFFTSIYVGVYFASKFESIYWKNHQQFLDAGAQVATRIANYQSQRVRFEGKDIERAMADTLRLIKDTLVLQNESSSYIWIGRYIEAADKHQDQVLYSSISESEQKKIQAKIGSLNPYLSGERPARNKEFIVFSLKDWGWYGVYGFDSQRLQDEIGNIKVRIYFFFIFLICLMLICIIGPVYFTMQNYQRIEQGYKRENVIFKNSPDYLVLLDQQGKVVDVSDYLLQQLRLKPEEMLQLPAWETPWWDHSNNSRHKITQAVEACRHRKILNIFSQHPTGLGDIIQVHHRMIPLLDDADQLAYILDWGIDANFLDNRISHRDELNACASYFFENSSEAFIVHGIERGIIVANLAAQRFFRVKEAGELIGNQLTDFSSSLQLNGEDSGGELSEAFAITMAKGEHEMLWKIKSADGEERIVEMTLLRGVLGQDQVIYISFSAQSEKDRKK